MTPRDLKDLRFGNKIPRQGHVTAISKEEEKGPRRGGGTGRKVREEFELFRPMFFDGLAMNHLIRL